MRAQTSDLEDAERARRQYERRRASVFTDDDGMVRLDAALPPDMGAKVKSVLNGIEDEMFRGRGSIVCTSQQRMADSIREMARRADVDVKASPSGNGPRRARTEMVVLVDNRLLFDQLDEAVANERLPRYEVPGVGELAPATARRLACEAAIIPMVMGGESQPQDVGMRRYRITSVQRLALIGRDSGCV